MARVVLSGNGGNPQGIGSFSSGPTGTTIVHTAAGGTGVVDALSVFIENVSAGSLNLDVYVVISGTDVQLVKSLAVPANRDVLQILSGYILLDGQKLKLAESTNSFNLRCSGYADRAAL